MTNAAQAAWDHANAAPESIALRGAGEPWSYAHLQRHAAAVAGALRDAGVRAGERVLMVCPPVPEFAGVYFGIHVAGAVAVTANVMCTRSELVYFARDSGCRLVLDWHEVGPAARQAAEALGLLRWEVRPDLDGIASSGPFAAPHAVDGDDLAVLLYTSGTTGRPKGAQLTHANLIAAAEISAEVLRLSPEDRLGTALPLFHIFGQGAIMGTALRAGASLSLLARFEASALLEMLRRDRLSALYGVPTMWNAMLQAAGDYGPEDFRSLRVAVSGGAAMPVEILRAFEQRFECDILEGYGLTETTGLATFNALDRRRRPGSVGPRLPRCNVEIRGADGRPLPTGAVGELCVSGPTVMRGYWNRPEETAEVLQDGWLRTGDLATEDADGDFRIVDRIKDLIIRGGYNVYPREVEEVLYEHPDIVEVAVVGVPDDHFGEEIAAVVALKPGATLHPTEIRAWAKEQLSSYKVPRLFQEVDALPKGSTGKILKRAIDIDALRATAWRVA